ncbi:hypothetical protein GTO10_05950 [Candidatus Saccharibacteria bacterium]|nr:hypothetical protein [Candidatus Saccharibacteria bacterium]
MRILPSTPLGKWTVGLTAFFFLLFGTFQLLVASGQRGGATFFSNPLLAIPGLLMGISGIAAFFTGAFSVVRSKERSILVFLATLFGLFVLIFVLGEILYPH